jgi:hypothetical protein
MPTQARDLPLPYPFITRPLERPREVRLSQVRVTRRDVLLIFWQIVQDVIRQAQRVLQHLLGRQAHPLRDRDVVELGRLQDLDHDDVVVAHVLDVVAVGLRDVADVAGLVVEGARAARGDERRHARASRDEEVPLVGRQVPVDLAHGAWADGDERGRDVGGDGEGLGVEDLDLAAFDAQRLLLRPVVGVALVYGGEAGGAGDVLRRDVAGHLRAGEDVQLVLGQVGELGHVGAQRLGHDALRVAQEHLGDQRGALLAEGARVEDQQELGALWAGLQRVRHTRGEEPDVARVQVVDKVLALFVHGGDAYRAVHDVGPLAGRVPVQLPVRVRLEVHVDASHLGCGREHVYVLLTRPPTVLGTEVVV